MTKASASLEPLEKPKSLDEQAYLHIKEAILTCALAPGEALAEVRLAEELGVSKTPIRKAMARLQQEGFVVTVPYKGHLVADISAKDVAEIYELRQILECHLVRHTTLLFTPAELEEMNRLLHRAQAALERDDKKRYVMLNRRFHHMFDRKYSHRHISDVLTNLDEHVQRIILYTQQNAFGDLLEKQRDDHRLILEAVEERNVEVAVKLMEDHLIGFKNELLARMESQLA